MIVITVKPPAGEPQNCASAPQVRAGNTEIRVNTERRTRRESVDNTAMAQDSVQQEFQNQFNDVVSRLESKQLFQTDWDIAAFAIFFIFIGMVLLLVILVIIRCCCCCCCDEKPRRHKVGMDNLALEP